MPQKQNANDKTFSENIKIVKQKFLEKFQQNVYLMEIEFRFFLCFDLHSQPLTHPNRPR